LQLGKGTFGDVYKGAHKHRHGSNRKKPWHYVAIKKTAPTVLDRRDGGGTRIRTTFEVEERVQEIKTLIKLREGNPAMSPVLYMYEYFWDYNRETGKGDIFLVTELLGQELDQWRQQQQVFMESSAKRIASVLLEALDFMHSRNVVHRDIKLQNILFRKNGDFRTLKIVDFGLAKVLDHDRTARDFCGSLGYIAPEIYQAMPYQFEVDMFAFGVVLFRLLSGARPFACQNQEKLKADTIGLRYTIQGRNWEGISQEALKLVRKLLIGPEQRFTAEECIRHDWFSAQEESILHADYSQVNDYAGNEGDSYSRAIALVRLTTGRARCFCVCRVVSDKELTSLLFIVCLCSHTRHQLPPITETEIASSSILQWIALCRFFLPASCTLAKLSRHSSRTTMALFVWRRLCLRIQRFSQFTLAGFQDIRRNTAERYSLRLSKWSS
jgi:serine/threonine protein kinase